MSDIVAGMLLILLLTAFGLSETGCNFRGPGLPYQIDGVHHHFKIGDR